MQISDLTLRSKIVLTILLVAGCLVAASALTYRSMQRMEYASSWTNHTAEVLFAISTLETQLLNMETGQRGFLLTGEAPYLDPYRRAGNVVKDSLEGLLTLTADNALQQRNVGELGILLNDRIKLMDDSLALYQQRGTLAAIAFVKSNNGRVLMDEIRDTLQNMRSEEQALLVKRRAEERASRKLNNLIILSSTAATLIFLLFIGLLIRSDLRLRTRLRQTLESLALQDALTGLPNRVAFNNRLNAAVANAMRKQRKLAVLYFDLDGFKAINDRFGHTAGDQLLHKISQRAQNELRAGDYLARYGGDEFILLIDEIAESAEAGVIAKKIIHAVSLPVVFENGDEGRVSASVGISLFPEDDTRPERLIQMADEAMYRAKQAGKAKFRYHARTVPEAI